MVRLRTALACLLALVGTVRVAAPAELAVAPGELQAALRRASPGDTLRLGAGVHPGPITIETTVHLVGSEGAVLEGPGDGDVLTVAASGTTISDLTVRGSGAELADDDTVILLREVTGVAVERCRVEARGFGVYLQAGGEHRIVDNEVVGDTSLPLVRRGNGIHLWKTVENEIDDNRLVDVRDGVYLSFAHDNRIHGNRGSGLRYGIHYMYSERNTLTENRFSACTGGIALMFSMKNRIERNETVDNEQFGILCQLLEHSRLADNYLAGNGRGFYLQNSAANRFAGNRLESNGVGAYLTAGSERNQFVSNRFAGNLVQVFEDHPGDNAFFEEGRGNFWGDYAGFDWDGDGVGETPYRMRTAASALLARRPLARWFWRSPALALLDWWDARISYRPASAFDPYPLVQSPEEVSR